MHLSLRRAWLQALGRKVNCVYVVYADGQCVTNLSRTVLTTRWVRTVTLVSSVTMVTPAMVNLATSVDVPYKWIPISKSDIVLYSNIKLTNLFLPQMIFVVCHMGTV